MNNSYKEDKQTMSTISDYFQVGPVMFQRLFNSELVENKDGSYTLQDSDGTILDFLETLWRYCFNNSIKWDHRLLPNRWQNIKLRIVRPNSTIRGESVSEIRFVNGVFETVLVKTRGAYPSGFYSNVLLLQ